MNEKYKILVVEDNPKHLDDVRGLITQRNDLIDVVYATNLSEAISTLDSQFFDGVLSDAHFPKEVGSNEAPCGIGIIDYTMNKKMPVTIVTSAYHHGKKTQPIYDRALDSGIALIDEYIEGNKEGETASKRWNDGLATLVYLVDKTREGKVIFRDLENPFTGNTQLGMIDLEGEAIRFSLPPYVPNALDETKQKLRLYDDGK